MAEPVLPPKVKDAIRDLLDPGERLVGAFPGFEGMAPLTFRLSTIVVVLAPTLIVQAAGADGGPVLAAWTIGLVLMSLAVEPRLTQPRWYVLTDRWLLALGGSRFLPPSGLLILRRIPVSTVRVDAIRSGRLRSSLGFRLEDGQTTLARFDRPWLPEVERFAADLDRTWQARRVPTGSVDV